jgi:osmotically-inducible protein OsmY
VTRWRSLLGSVGIVSAVASLAAAPDEAHQTAEKVRRALGRVPYYGVFDFLAFKVEGSVVTLQGYAYRPALKREVESAVKRATGLDVASQIEVLPALDFDDRIRWDVYSRVYTEDFADKYVSGGTSMVRRELLGMARFPDMEPYGNYPIHIVVKNRRVALLGVVGNQFDKEALLIRAKQTPSASGLDDFVAISPRG